jgi:hypothetical protein
LKERTYPRIDIDKVSNWLSALSTYGLPLTEMSSRKLNEKEKKGQISRDLKEKIKSWKKSKKIDDQDDLEYKYFLEGIEALLHRPLEKEDLYVPLLDDLTLGDIADFELTRKTIYYLSKLGCRLSGYWDSRQHDLYEAMLFWLIIRSKSFNPLIQKLLSDRRLYQMGFQDDLIPSRDGISRGLLRKWLQHFSLIKNNKLDESKLAILLLYALIFEINEAVKKQNPAKFYVEELERIVSKQFSISTPAIDMGVMLEWLYSSIGRQTMVGFPSGRGHKGLPSKPSVQILEINNQIPLSIVSEVQSYEIRKAISFGGAT